MGQSTTVIPTGGGGAKVQDSIPTNPQKGDLWVDTSLSTPAVKWYDGVNFTQVVPNSTTGATGNDHIVEVFREPTGGGGSYSPTTRFVATLGIDSTGNSGANIDITANYVDGTSETFSQSYPFSSESFQLAKAVDSISWPNIGQNEVFLEAKAPELEL